MFRLMVFTTVLGLTLTATAAPQDCEKALLGRKGIPVGQLSQGRNTKQIMPMKVQSVKASKSAIRMAELAMGTVNAEALEAARSSYYRVEVKSRLSFSSKAVEVRLDQLLESLVANGEKLNAARNSARSAEDMTMLNAKSSLQSVTAQLLTLGAKRYSGTNSELVIARDAYARQVETGVKMADLNSTAKLQEIVDHLEVVRAILNEKVQNPMLTDAAATLRGVEAAHKESFVKRCADGSCKVPSDEVLAAGARSKLQEMKDCI